MSSEYSFRMQTAAKKIAVLGASRGLGRALKLEISANEANSKAGGEIRGAQFLLAARNEEKLGLLKSQQDLTFACDFTKTEDQARLLNALIEFQPTHIFYVAGGGPYGRFESKKWADHAWALELNFNWPARMLHTIMSHLPEYKNLKQIVFVGSAIAGQGPDPMAASYAAAKHALRGLITSVRKENPSLDIRLYEPGYMATDMLPPSAWPRQQGLAKSPEDEARALWQWAQSTLD